MADRDFAAYRPLANFIRVRAATTANITIASALNNGDTLDGVTLADGMLVLVKDQSTPAENGIYVVGTVPRRYVDYSADIRGTGGAYDMHPGLVVVVEAGTANADTLWLCTSNRGGTLGTTAIAFAQQTPLGGVSAFALTLLDDANAAAALTTLGVSSFIQTILDDASATAALATLGIVASTYTPAHTHTTNVAASTAYVCLYIQVGANVFVFGRADIDPTAAAPTATVMGISLPVASNFSSGVQAHGTGASADVLQGGGILSDATNDRVTYTFQAQSVNNTRHNFSFAYLVI